MVNHVTKMLKIKENVIFRTEKGSGREAETKKTIIKYNVHSKIEYISSNKTN